MADEKIHDQVQRAYAEAVTSTGCGCGKKGVAVEWAGYSTGELDTLPASVVENAFGCGNPLAFSDVQPGQTVLDLGCGAGIDLLIASRRVGPSGRVIGVDMTDEMIEAARRNISKSGVANVEVRKGMIEDLPVETASVDWVISNCVINLSPDKPGVFAEIARVLRPGGWMQVSDLVAEDLPEWVRKDESLYNSCIAGAISEKEYIRGLESAGLTQIEVVDRLAYDALQVRELASSELGQGCCGGGSVQPGVEKVLERARNELAGKVVSINIKALKPAL